MIKQSTRNSAEDIAIIGIACRFPGAKNVEEFWQNLRDGVESISFFSREEMVQSGVPPAVLDDPNYVGAGGALDDIELFDASFFGFSPREAEIIDPQHRLFLETAWEALERAGYNPDTYQGLIGVYAGAGANTYLWSPFSNGDLVESLGHFQTLVGNDKDFLPSRVSYKLNLKGPSLAIQTACSTSLVAVCLACQSLQTIQCDIALAGGVSVRVPQKAGYIYQEGGIMSPDGHCRAFDAKAGGTVDGNGVGIVVLKRLAEAIADGDCIYAVIKACAINNDGGMKVGYTAPSIDGQAEAIMMALAMAEVDAGSITYIETHGTGTVLGDPIEIEALTQAFRVSADRQGFCAIGSVKTNVGHLDAAAGVAGLIKTALSLKHRLLPPSLHFENANPKIDFAHSPFYVNTALSKWEGNGTPLRAGVSSFGIGGTNAHIIVEEAPDRAPSGPARASQLLLLSARTANGLEMATANLIEHFKRHPDVNLADAAYTMQVGRKHFDHRRMAVCRDVEDAIVTLEGLNPKRVFTGHSGQTGGPVAFLFSGQGSQYVEMGLGLYEDEPRFRSVVDECCESLQPCLGFDLRKILYPSQGQAEEAARKLDQTAITQPALFVVEYALAQLWISWGIRPKAMIGHSIGEYVAACLAGVFPLRQALELVAVRGQMMQQIQAGSMLVVQLPVEQVEPLLGEDLSLAAVNGPALCVVSGATKAVETLELKLTERNIACRRLHTSHAFHSHMMNPIVEPFARRVNNLKLRPPQIPYLSNVTGTFITASEATDPDYWARHLRQCVRFADGLAELLKEPGLTLLEVGPGNTLTTLVNRHQNKTRNHFAISSLRHPTEHRSDIDVLLNAAGQLWLSGKNIDWVQFRSHERRLRVTLPTYPFERQRYLIDRPNERFNPDRHQKPQADRRGIAEWFYVPSWKRGAPSALLDHTEVINRKSRWLILMDGCGLGEQIAERLKQEGHQVITVTMGQRFHKFDEYSYALDPSQRDHYETLLEEVGSEQEYPDSIIHLWSLTSTATAEFGVEAFERNKVACFYSLLFLAQELGGRNITTPIRITVISNDLYNVTGDENLSPEKAVTLGLCKTIPQEYPHVSLLSIDIALPEAGSRQEKILVDQLFAELFEKTSAPVLSFRNGYRWAQTFEAIRVDPPAEPIARLRRQGVYLITGGLGGIGLIIAEHLARAAQARLVLVGRSPFPERSAWEQWLAAHDEQDPVCQKISRLEALERLGAEILVASADVANEGQMRQVLEKAVTRFGDINGVIHSAGHVGAKSIHMIAETGWLECERAFQSKVYGLYVLEKLLRGKELDFCLLQSSLSSILGGLGFVSYSAANLFMDAFAQKQSRTGDVPWISVNWDAWQLDSDDFQAKPSDMVIKPEEGTDVLQRVLSMPYGAQVIISTGDLGARIDRHHQHEHALKPKDSVSTSLGSLSRHQRPALHDSYIEPRNEIEWAICDIWKEWLGIEQVGVHDNFFELGGHSLLATQIASRVRSFFQVELSSHCIFKTATIAELAVVINEKLAQRNAGEPISQALAESDLIGGAGQAIASSTLEQGSERDLKPDWRLKSSDDGARLAAPGQKALWFLHKLNPESMIHNLAFGARVNSDLDMSALRLSFQALLDRHSALRTSFKMIDGKLFQQVQENVEIDFRHESARNWSDEILKQRLNEEAHRPFDLQRDSLLRVRLFTINPNERYLVFVVHHIAFDFWSLVIFMQELGALYDAGRRGRSAQLPSLRAQYTDFSRWQSEMLEGPEGERLLQYWMKQLAGELPVLNLPIDRPRQPVQTNRGAIHSLRLKREQSGRLKALAHDQKTTLYMTLLASFYVLLHRYTGQEDILVGSPAAGRSRSEFERVIGYFMNPLILRADLSGHPPFNVFLQKFSETVVSALEHQDYPTHLLVEQIRPTRSPGHSPLFQVMFIFNRPQQIQHDEMTGFLLGEAATRGELAGLRLESLAMEERAAICDIALWMYESEGRLSASFQYDIDLFDSTTIARMASNFETLLESILINHRRSVSDLPLLTDRQRHQLLVEWNNTRADYPGCESIHQMFEAQAEELPHTVALVFEDKHLTYRELNRRANQLAHRLIDLGMDRGATIGLYLERAPELIVGILGSLKAGGDYVPLDPAYPAERIAFMMKDSRIGALVTQAGLSAELPEHDAPRILIDVETEILARYSDRNPSLVVAPEDRVYLIYTSGSTGKPKGVPVRHGALINHTKAAIEEYQFVVGDRVLQFASISFDASAEEIFTTLAAGATLVLRNDRMLGSVDEFLSVCDDWSITVLDLPTAYWHRIVTELNPSIRPLPKSLRLMILGGERALVDLLARWKEQAGEDLRLINTYGPTEATIVAIRCELSQNEQEARALREAPIGRPIPNVQAYVLDRRMDPTPIGAAGELYLGGAGLAEGYLNRPELTAEFFIPNPFNDEYGDFLYRTGDLARYLPEGNIEFLGRADDQVKIEGFRVEIGEIETIIRQHPAVCDAVVSAKASIESNKRLVAYVVAGHGENLSSHELRGFLKTKLPAYMIPSAFVMMDGLPLTPNGKVDYQALHSMELEKREFEGSHAAPTTLIEAKLCEIWSEVLDLEKVGIYDNFFDLGGDSIIGIQIVSKANQMGLQLAPRHLFQHQTIAELATLAGKGQIINAEQGPVTGVVPLTPYQRWFFEQNFFENHHWNMAVLLEPLQLLDADVLSKALEEVAGHHDMLRARFERRESRWIQEIKAEAGVGFKHLNYSNLNPGRQREAIEIAAEEAQRSLDLSRGPLMRAVLMELGPSGGQRLLLVIHHLVVDGVSWRVLLEDLERAYEQIRRGERVDLGWKTTSYKKWAEKLEEYAESGALEGELDYWIEKSQACGARLPVDYETDESQNTEQSARIVQVKLSEEETRQLLQEAHRVYNTKINDLLLTALAEAICSWTGEERLRIDLEGHGREELFEDVDLSRTVGCFTALFPVLLDLKRSPGPETSLITNREELRNIQKGGVGYGLLRYLSGDPGIAAKLKGGPRAQVLFNYLGQFDQGRKASMFIPASEPVAQIRSPRAKRSHQIEILGSVTGGELELMWIYSENIHKRSTIEDLAEEFIRSLQAIVTRCQSIEGGDYSPSDFPLAKLDQFELELLENELEAHF